MQTAKEIGYQPAFPSPANYAYEGMTYRQWLIGQALSDMASVAENNREEIMAREDIADDCIGIADAILQKLAAETRG